MLLRLIPILFSYFVHFFKVSWEERAAWLDASGPDLGQISEGNLRLASVRSDALVTSRFLLLLVRHWLLEAMHLFLVASCYY